MFLVLYEMEFYVLVAKKYNPKKPVRLSCA